MIQEILNPSGIQVKCRNLLWTEWQVRHISLQTYKVDFSILLQKTPMRWRFTYHSKYKILTLSFSFARWMHPTFYLFYAPYEVLKLKFAQTLSCFFYSSVLKLFMRMSRSAPCLWVSKWSQTLFFVCWTLTISFMLMISWCIRSHDNSMKTHLMIACCIEMSHQCNVQLSENWSG